MLAWFGLVCWLGLDVLIGLDRIGLTMNRRVFGFVLGTIAVLLVSTAAAVAVWIGSHSPLALLAGGTRTEPEAAVFVPKQAPVMVSLLANLDRLEHLRQVITPLNERRDSHRAWDKLRDRLLAKTGLNYDRDIRPWLGDELTLAVTSLDRDRDPKNGQSPGYLLAAAVADPAAAKESLQLFWQQQAVGGTSLVFEQYQGASIVYGESLDLFPGLGLGKKRPGRTDLATAVVGDRFVLIANDPKVLHEAINNAQAPDLSLATVADYRSSLTTLAGERLGIAFVSGPDLADLLQQIGVTPTIPAKTPATKGEPVKPLPIDRLVVSLDLNATGLALDGLFLGREPGELARRVAPLSRPVPALNYVPANALLAVGGENLTTLAAAWRDRLAGTTLDRQVQPFFNVVRQYAGFDWQRDVFDWADHDYALALVPADSQEEASERALGEFPADWVFVARRSPDTAAAIDRIDALARKQGLTIGQLALNEGETTEPATVWTQLIAPPQGGLFGKRSGAKVAVRVQGARASFTGESAGSATGSRQKSSAPKNSGQKTDLTAEYEVLGTSLAAVDQVLQAAAQPHDPSRSLTARSSFQDAIAVLAQPNEGYAYLDWQQGRKAIVQSLPVLRWLDLVARPIVNHLDWVALNLAGGEPDTRRVSLFARWRST